MEGRKDKYLSDGDIVRIVETYSDMLLRIALNRVRSIPAVSAISARRAACPKERCPHGLTGKDPPCPRDRNLPKVLAAWAAPEECPLAADRIPYFICRIRSISFPACLRHSKNGSPADFRRAFPA